jgi:hypothetical protein
VVSSSRSSATRVPDPGGTQVKVSSWPAVLARLRSADSVSVGSSTRSLWNWFVAGSKR